MSTSVRHPVLDGTTPRWRDVPDRFRRRGLRWTQQRRAVVDALARASGHVTAAELVERCRADDPTTTPSTVYRTLDVLEELGLVRHGHDVDGREEFHVAPVGAKHRTLGTAVRSLAHELELKNVRNLNRAGPGLGRCAATGATEGA